jgi:hypothetical protein
VGAADRRALPGAPVGAPLSGQRTHPRPQHVLRDRRDRVRRHERPQFSGETRHYDRFSQALAEITEARIWAGLHYRTADVQAKVLGNNVADYMAAHYFQPVG